MDNKIKLHVPAANLECLFAAARSGADAVYFGFNTASNLRNFKGINFSYKDAATGIEYLHSLQRKALITINSLPQKNELPVCFEAIDKAADMQADGVILSDLALLEYAKRKYPKLPLYLSVQAGACNAGSINFFAREFGICCAILPRVVTLEEIAAIHSETNVTLEAFAFGSLCINYEGKCGLSSYITGESTNTTGTCSTPRFLSFSQGENGIIARINGKAINYFAERTLPQEELTAWGNQFLINRRQLCKAQYRLNINMFGAAGPAGAKGTPDNSGPVASLQLNDFVYLNTLEILPQLVRSGIGALKIEGRQRNAAYVREITHVFRQAIDVYYLHPAQYVQEKDWLSACQNQFPGNSISTTCYLGK